MGIALVGRMREFEGMLIGNRGSVVDVDLDNP